MRDMNISEIEALTESEVREECIESIEIKGHTCYFVYFNGGFGYSILVFKNGRHMYYANDYELHHSNHKGDYVWLKAWYIDGAKRKLFTEEELCTEIKTYDEYERKGHYLRNYWIQQFDHVSMWYIGEPSKEQKKAERKGYVCSPCFAYVNEQSIVDRCEELFKIITSQWKRLKEDENVFREMVAHELANHEYCITCDYTDALSALGFTYKSLTDRQRQILHEEGRKQIENYA